jgi:hypothetical protein
MENAWCQQCWAAEISLKENPQAELHVVFGFNSVAGWAIHKLPLERKKGRQKEQRRLLFVWLCWCMCLLTSFLS